MALAFQIAVGIILAGLLAPLLMFFVGLVVTAAVLPFKLAWSAGRALLAWVRPGGRELSEEEQHKWMRIVESHRASDERAGRDWVCECPLCHATREAYWESKRADPAWTRRQ